LLLVNIFQAWALSRSRRAPCLGLGTQAQNKSDAVQRFFIQVNHDSLPS
jgi:hypothetical protein